MAQPQVCQNCKAVIQPEHIDQGRAGRWAGQLLCSTCYAQKKGGASPAAPAAPATPNHPPAVQAAPVAPAAHAAHAAHAVGSDAEAPISLEDGPAVEAGGSK